MRALLLSGLAVFSLSCASSNAKPAEAESKAAPPAAPVASAPAPLPAPPALRLPDTVAPKRYALELTLLPTEPTFSGQIAIEVEVKAAVPVIWIHGTDLDVKEAKISSGGKELAARVVPGNAELFGLVPEAPLAPGPATLRLSYAGKVATRDTEGLFTTAEDGERYLVSHFEPLSARRAFPCFDEPHFKVPWQLTLHVKKEHVALSNTRAEEETDEANGMKKVRFAQTQPLPSYLVALAVGPFELVDAGVAGAKKTPIRIAAQKGRAAEAKVSVAIAVPLLERLEAYFGIPYPFDKLDMVSVPLTAGFGAMENPGLITYNKRILLVRPEDDSLARARGRAGTVAHEMAHLWFGDLVTMAWWDDLWLNESFASWMADRVVSEWKPEWDVDVTRLGGRFYVMNEDGLVSARKIRQPIESRDDIANAFDGITYVKGQAILGMFERWLGPATFQKGVQRYLRANAYGNATAENFLRAVSEEAGRDVAPLFSTFLDQQGFPRVTAALTCKPGEKPALHLAQQRFLPAGSAGIATETLWKVPVCARFGGPKGGGRACTVLDQREGTLTLDTPGCPAWVLPNAGGDGYYRVKLEGDLLARLFKAAPKSLTVPERVALLNDLSGLINSGDVPAADALAVVPQAIADGNWHAVAGAARLVSRLREPLVAPEQRAAYARYLRKVFGPAAKRAGFKPSPKDDAQLRLTRPFLVYLVAVYGEDAALVAEAKTLALAWLTHHAAVDAELVDTVLGIAVATGDRALSDRIRALAEASKDREERRHLFAALSESRDPAVVEQNVAALVAGTFDIREAGQLLAAPFREPETREQVYALLKRDYDKLVEKLPRTNHSGLASLTSRFCDATHREDARAFFEPRQAKAEGGPRVLRQMLEEIDLCIGLLQAQGPSVKAFLQKS